MGRLKRILLFFTLAVVIYALAIFFMSHVKFQGSPLIIRTGNYYTLPGGYSWQRFHEFDPAAHWDAIILGSSHAYRGYDPAVFAEKGYRVFNLGSSGQTPLNSYFLIKHYLDSMNCPLLIFDMYEGTMQNTGLDALR